MPKRQRHRTAHEMTITRLWRVLLQEYPDDDIWLNSAFRKETRPLPGTNFFPDGLNYSKKLAYEVHWAGSRKEVQREDYPEGWKLVNVYIADIHESENYVFNLNGEYVHITAKDWERTPR